MSSQIKTMSIADIHLCGGWETDEAQALLKAVQIAVYQDVNIVLVNGDVYHSKSTPDQRMVFKTFLGQLQTAGIQVVVLRGNHDDKNDLKIFHDPDRGIHVFEEPGQVNFAPNLLTIHAIPHYNAAALALEESSQDAIGETGTGLYDQLVQYIFQQVQATNHPTMVIFHGTVTDAHLDNGMIPKHDGIVLNGPLLASLGCPVRGGHYHAAQEPHHNVRYSGSIVLRNYGEKGDKGVLIDTFQDGRWTGCEFVSLEPTPRVTVEAEWDSFMVCFVIRVSGRPFVITELNPSDFTGAKVRFRYKVRQSEIQMISLEEIRQWFEAAGVRELKFERDLIIETAIRSELIHQASTVLEMHATWLAMKGLESHIPAQKELYKQIIEGESVAHEATIA